MVIGAQMQVGSAQAGSAQDAQTQPEMLAQQAIPDAPKPQAVLPDLNTITPGKGAAAAPDVNAPTANPAFTPGKASGETTTPAAPAASAKTSEPTGASDLAPVGDSANAATIVTRVNIVPVPFTVKNSKGKLVAGLTANDIRVYENDQLQRIDRFTTDAAPLSVALVVDQTLDHDDMQRVDDALGALQGAFTKYDEIAVFTYNNGPKTLTDFTGAQSARLTQAVIESKGLGRDTLMAGSLSGPLSQNTVINNMNFDPNTTAVRGQNGIQLSAPKEQHTLNDAILAAAKALSTRPVERRRVIYIISDGKEYGSKAKTRDVIRYLQTNGVEVDGTLVGDSSLPVVGFLDHLHLPMTMHDNILPQFANATGGVLDAEFRTGEIEKSFARIASEVRSRYTLEYHSHLSPLDNKFRSINVVVVNHGNDLTIMAKKGYYPLAQPVRAHATTSAK
jgi:VWFA-related protein